jgi:hypothetical protein
MLNILQNISLQKIVSTVLFYWDWVKQLHTSENKIVSTVLFYWDWVKQLHTSENKIVSTVLFYWDWVKQLHTSENKIVSTVLFYWDWVKKQLHTSENKIVSTVLFYWVKKCTLLKTMIYIYIIFCSDIFYKYWYSFLRSINKSWIWFVTMDVGNS